MFGTTGRAGVAERGLPKVRQSGAHTGRTCMTTLARKKSLLFFKHIEILGTNRSHRASSLVGGAGCVALRSRRQSDEPAFE